MEKLDVITASPLFEMLSQEELAHLAELAGQRRYAAGEVIFEEGALGDSLFVIVKGEVEVVHREGDAVRPITVLTSPAFFGEMSVIDKEYRSATLRARTDAELLQLTMKELGRFRQAHRDGFTFIVINIARILSARLREANARLAGNA
ncbi:cyclic nucleotide-binding domain-containing protein [Hyalangium rubrum]|uniref:Cyclic nucleotide-binding domain-containing protein n=1 Tax=Hyalangium rubrum TaxID=3103134 RepID=A0ABU5H7E1_9BACT|nr:cyclic nucleotide-binding domain-containing protein [Hyalangium sp. s54d21]MDY7229014.1 cyclic nucleotide-binding domain-containing protein [Hyalangium sp. s54d21]